MGIGTFVLILVLKRTTPRVPAALAGVVLALVATWLFGLDEHGIAVVGDIDAGVPWPAWPVLPADDWLALIGTAAAVALVGYADSILTAAVWPIGTGTRSTQIANSPGSASPTPPRDCARACRCRRRGRAQRRCRRPAPTRPWAGSSPPPSSAWDSWRSPGFWSTSHSRRWRPSSRRPRSGSSRSTSSRISGESAGSNSRIALLTASSVILFDVLIGIVVSVVLSLVIAVYRIARPHDAVLGDAAELDGWVSVDDYPQAVVEPGLLVYRFDAPLFFTNAGRYCERVLLALRNQPGIERWVVLDMEGVGSIDGTAVASLRGLVDDVGREGVEVIAVARANPRALDRLGRAGLLRSRRSDRRVRHDQRSGPSVPREHHVVTRGCGHATTNRQLGRPAHLGRRGAATRVDRARRLILRRRRG